MSIGARSIGVVAIGASKPATVRTRRSVSYASGAIGTFAIGAGDIGATVSAAAAAASGGINHVVRWRRNGRR